MVIMLEEFKNICNNILPTVNSSELNTLTNLLNLKVNNSKLELRVTDGEYVICKSIPIDSNEELNVTVEASIFLKLISQMTSDTLELTQEDKFLKVVGNGTYQLELIYNGDSIQEINDINLTNITCETTLKLDNLLNILTYNSKEIRKRDITNPIQYLYYFDNEGCITFSSGACVNTFKNDVPFKILLNSKVVKLFKLFDSQDISFNISHELINDQNISIVKFSDTHTCVTTKLRSDDNLISTVPVSILRDRALSPYKYNFSINKDVLLQAINRILVFNDNPLSSYKISIKDVYLTIFGINEDCFEDIYFNTKESLNIKEYNTNINLSNLKDILMKIPTAFINVSFGNEQCIVISFNGIYIVIPECEE